jgi:parallel beta-helix repeat protein
MELEVTIPDGNEQSSILGDILYVGGSGPDNYTRIQDAVDNSSEGDTVFVFDDSSPYKELVSISKAINLVGEDNKTTIIDSHLHKYHNNIYIVADGVNVSGFTLLNSLDNGFMGIQVWRYGKNCIRNNIIIGMDKGISVSFQSDNNNIINNEIIDCETGISIRGSYYNQAGNNKLLNNKCGISLGSGSKNNAIFNNCFIDNGIAVRDSSYPNTFYGNSINDKPLIYLENGSDILFETLQAGQIILINCDNIIIKNLEISKSTYGIELINSDNCIISNITIYSNKYDGIYLEDDCDNNIIVDNRIMFNSNGLTLLSDYDNPCINNFITGNTISHNRVNGLSLSRSCQNNISDNIIQENGFLAFHWQTASGIHLRSKSDNNSITRNIVQDNLNGITLNHSSYNTISRNLVSNSSNIGISIDNSVRNKIETNNIINNKLSARFIRYSYLKNLWKSNYWDDWMGIGPKIIWGQRMFLISYIKGEAIYFKLPWIQFDWHPAKEQYHI